MRILVVSHSCANTPLSQQLYAELSASTGWDVDIVAPSNWKDEYGRSCELQRLPGFTGQLIGLPVIKSGSVILHAYRASIPALLRRLNPDVIYVHHEAYAVATAQIYFANAGSRPIGFYSAQNISKRYPAPFRWSENRVYQQSAFALPCSTNVESVLRGKGYDGLSTVLPLPIDCQTYRPSEAAAAVRSKLLGKRKCLLGYVGRLVREKGLATLFAAAGKLTDLDWQLALVGSGDMEAELRKQAHDLGIADRITFVGFVPHAEAPPYLSAFDVLVLPSETQANWREQFGRVLLEAMACRTPVVGSDSGEIPVLIRATGGGLVFRERDIDDLASKLRNILCDPALATTLAAAGRSAVEQEYSTPAVVGRLTETLETVMSSSSHKRAAATDCRDDDVRGAIVSAEAVLAAGGSHAES